MGPGSNVTDGLDAIARARRFAAIEHAPGSDAAWLAAALKKYDRAGGAITLDEAVGVAPKHGEWPWWRLEKRAQERKAARELVDAFGGLGEALRGLERFAKGRWKCTGPGAHYEDPKSQAAHDYLLATGGRVPDSPRTLDRAATKNDN